MIKLYLETVAIYFLIFIASGLAFKKAFHEAQDKYNKAMKQETKRIGYLKTTIMYLLISFIPIIRVLELYAKLFFTIHPDKVIKRAKELKEEDEEEII